MPRRHRLLVVGLLLWGIASPALAQPAKERYETALGREQSLRDAAPMPLAKESRLVVRALEDVARQHPTSGYADDALWRAAALASDTYTWHGDRVDAQTAERLLRWLVREYPHSKHNRPAAGRLEQLGAPPTAAKTEATPSNPSAAPASPAPAVATAVAPTSGPKPTPTVSTAPVAPSASSPAERAGGSNTTSMLKSVKRTVSGGVERVALELEGEVAYREERLKEPSRLFFDLQRTNVTRELLTQVQTFDANAVRQIRLGKHPNGVTRVVLNLEGDAAYSVFTLYNPYRIVVEFPVAEAAVASAKNAPVPAAATPPTPTPAPAAAAATPRAATPVPEPAPPAAAKSSLPKTPAPTKPTEIARETGLGESALVLPPAEPPVILGSSATTSLTAAGSVEHSISRSTEVALALPSPAPAVVTPRTAGAPVSPSITPEASAAATATKSPAEPSASPTIAPKAPATNVSGGFSLARQLGLGISRIVIDPGHGGHDPGAVGKGVTEAETTLDIGLRLEKLLAEDGTFEVVMTRKTDVFVPLEERTAIANRERADLFLSIHLNSSRSKSARGFETYYLSFASDPDAEAVAARENSASDQSMRNLSGIVQAIALNNKLDESRDLASHVQRSLSRRLRAQSKLVRDLGVKRAPFVVLIGASMPSVLAEVSFISHAQEMQLLKTAAYRQRIAQSLFDAIVQYRSALKTTESVAQHE